MPIYEYMCPGCESRFELMRPLSRASEGASCPQCHNGAKRIMSTFACFSTEGGQHVPLAGSNACASCGSMSCATCNM